MNEGLRQAICLRCKSMLDASAAEPVIVCSSCQHVYPVIRGQIPVLLAEPQKTIAQLCIQLERFLRLQEIEGKRIDESIQQGGTRSAILASMQAAIRENNRFIRTLLDDLLVHVTARDLLKVIDDGGPIPYATILNYLQRDWCWLPEAERELAIIRRVLAGYFDTYLPDSDAALVLGAGAGRIAWDLCEVFSQVYAMDSSPTMAYQFYSLLESDVVYYSVNTTGVFNAKDMIQKLTASLHPPQTEGAHQKDNRSRFSYFVGDATSTPLKSHFISAIISVYFTDLVHLAPLVQEAKRLLKPDGLFVHFGPLDYHFADRTHHLAADEVKEFFAANEFEVVQEAQVRTEHLASASCMTPRIYDNWAFTAVNRMNSAQAEYPTLDEHSILYLRDKVRYEARGAITAEGEEHLATSLDFASGERFQGAASALDILRLIDGSKSVRDVIAELAEKYDITNDGSREAIINTLKTLVEKKVLAVWFDREDR